MADPDDVLVAAWERFGDFTQNTSQMIIGHLDAPHSVVMPVSYSKDHGELMAWATAHPPRHILLIGQEVVDGVRIETTAHAEVTRDAADNDGDNWSGRRLGDVDELSTTADVQALNAAIEQTGVAGGTSDDAGGYVCNAVYYQLLADPPPSVESIVLLHVGTLAADGGGNDLDAYVAMTRAVIDAL